MTDTSASDASQDPSRPLPDRVHDRLLTLFADGRWAAGESLNIDQMARELDVSPTPMREALARLEYTGLVQRIARKGYQVAPLFTEKDLIRLMDARLVLEPAMTFEAARRTTPEFLSDVARTVDELLDAAAQPDRVPYLHIDERFHRLIAHQADNPFLERAYGALGGLVQRFRLFPEVGRSDASYAATEHGAIHAALREGDPDEAARRMSTHIENAKSRALSERQTIKTP